MIRQNARIKHHFDIKASNNKLFPSKTNLKSMNSTSFYLYRQGNHSRIHEVSWMKVK